MLSMQKEKKESCVRCPLGVVSLLLAVAVLLLSVGTFFQFGCCAVCGLVSRLARKLFRFILNVFGLFNSTVPLAMLQNDLVVEGEYRSLNVVYILRQKPRFPTKTDGEPTTRDSTNRERESLVRANIGT